MFKNQPTFSIGRMANIFCVSRSGFYYWLKNKDKCSRKKQIQKQLDDNVKLAFDEGKQREGARRLQIALAEKGNKRDVKTVI